MLKNEAREEGKRIASTEFESRLKEATEASKEEIKCFFDPLIAEYNARVIMHQDLIFLGEGYIESLTEAWETLTKIRKVELAPRRLMRRLW